MDDASVILNMFKTAGNVLHVAPDEAIFKEGDAGDCLYVLRAGNAQIRVGDKVVEIVSDGDIVGEMSLIDGSPRSADLIAVTPCQVVPVDVNDFTTLIQDTPFFAIYLMQALTRRLRQTDQMSAQQQSALGDMAPLIKSWPGLSKEVRAQILQLAGAG